jgi:hypothetical protein
MSDYNDIQFAPDEAQAAKRYLAYWYGEHVPFLFKPLIDHLIRSVHAGRSESEFRDDAYTMYAVREIPGLRGRHN